MIVNTGTARIAPGTPHIQYLKLREKDDRHWVYRESVREQQTLGFENSAVYQDAGDAFAAAQRSIVAPSRRSVPLHQQRPQPARSDHPRPD
jgi:hypothetical protein